MGALTVCVTGVALNFTIGTGGKLRALDGVVGASLSSPTEGAVGTNAALGVTVPVGDKDLSCLPKTVRGSVCKPRCLAIIASRCPVAAARCLTVVVDLTDGLGMLVRIMYCRERSSFVISELAASFDMSFSTSTLFKQYLIQL